MLRFTVAKILFTSLTTRNVITLMQNVLETLQIVAYLCIALISIVIAVYAIGISYLGGETLRSKWRKRKRRELLERKVKELGPKADVEGIKEEIERYNREITEIDNKLSYLYIWRAVIYPSICFLFALIVSVCSINVYPIGTIEFQGRTMLIGDLLIVGSIIPVVIGAFFLVKTLLAIEWIATGIALPEFKVTFEDGSTTNKYRVEEQVGMRIAVDNMGEKMAENVTILVFFDPKFDSISGETMLQLATSKHPNFRAVTLYDEFIHIDAELLFDPIYLKMPKEAGPIEIPVEIMERNTVGPSIHKLKLEIYS